MNRGATGKLVQLIVTATAVIALVLLSLWSLRNTIEFTALASTDGETWAVLAGLVIQFSPNVFLYLARRETDGNKKLIWRGLFWILTAVDAGTNVGKGLSLDRPIDIGNETAYQLARWMRLFFDVGVVFCEEGIEYFVGVFFDQVADLIDILGGEAPEWLHMANTFGNSGGRKKESKPQQNNQSGNNRGSQPQREQGNGRDHEFPLIDPRALNERDRGRDNRNNPPRR
jgi:hypothetical protein